MPRPSTSYDILIASPSDTSAERNLISECIRDWNAAHAQSGTFCHDVRWELDSVPGLGERPQAVLNKQLVDRADVLIGVFKTRLGSPTGVAKSGTIEEIERCEKAGKPVMLYFCIGAIPRDHDPEQLQMVKNYQKQLSGRGIYDEYVDLEDLRRKVTRHLGTVMTRIHGAAEIPEAPNDKHNVTSLGNHHPTPLNTEFPAAESKDGPARFRSPGEALGQRWDNLPFGMGSEAPVLMEKGPAIWIRVMPAFSLRDKRFPAHELKSKGLHSSGIKLQLMSDSVAMYGIRAADGFGLCSIYPPDSPTTSSVAFAFETGEVWAIDVDQLRYGQIIPFIEPLISKRLRDYSSFLKALGIEPPYNWICGLTGIKNFRLVVPSVNAYSLPGAGPKCLVNTIQKHGIYDGTGSAHEALLPFFQEIFDRCGVARPAHLPSK